MDTTNEKLQSWSEISEDDYYYLLEVLPPAAWKDNAFMVGEPWTHDDKGAVHQAVISIKERYFTRNAHIRQFNPGRYTQEVVSLFDL